MYYDIERDYDQYLAEQEIMADMALSAEREEKAAAREEARKVELAAQRLAAFQGLDDNSEEGIVIPFSSFDYYPAEKLLVIFHSDCYRFFPEEDQRPYSVPGKIVVAGKSKVPFTYSEKEKSRDGDILAWTYRAPNGFRVDVYND